MCTDTSPHAANIIRLYGLRFKVEHTFKQAVRHIRTFADRFWMADMKPLRRNNGDQHLHRERPEYRDHVKRKVHAYDVFIQASRRVSSARDTAVSGAAYTKLVWASLDPGCE